MFKIAVLIWMVLGTTLAGIPIIVIVISPSLVAHGMTLIPIFAAAGFILAVPLSYLIAKKIAADTMRRG